MRYVSENNLLLASLSGFRCPFEDDTSVVLCSFYSVNGYCPFLHKTDNYPSNLFHEARQVPPLICINSLVDQCELGWFWFIPECFYPIATPKMGVCPYGFHPSWIHLVDRNLLSRTVDAFKVVIGQARQESQLPDHKCLICWETIESTDSLMFGTMPKCRHIFCAGCLSKWLDGNYTCPTCRTWSPIMNNWFTAERVGASLREPKYRDFTARIISSMQAAFEQNEDVENGLNDLF